MMLKIYKLFQNIMTDGNIKRYVCVNCGTPVGELYKKYSNTVKTTHCDNCHQITDKYIEVEEFIIIIDALLLVSSAFRHMIYNGEFKLYWKISLVILMLESFALCRQTRGDGSITALMDEGFFTSLIQNVGEYLLIIILLFISAMILRTRQKTFDGIPSLALNILKAVVITNISKFFLLPILVWGSNTTDFGRNLHYLLATCHHLCFLVKAFNFVQGTQLYRLSTLLVVGAFIVKEYVRYIYAFQIVL